MFEMGKYTACDNPTIDNVVSEHLSRIVDVIRDQMEPQSIILYGSFGRGEGSVMIRDGQLYFLSDYEFNVVTLSPFYRSLLARLSHQLTTELGVDVSLRWARPDYMRTRRVGPLPMGPVATSIFLYESRYGSQTLYGPDIIRSSPDIDPCQISLANATKLVLNRMAESLYYMPKANNATLDDLEIFRWINKTILACAESLLLLRGQYHYSYEERGRRFAAMTNERLSFMGDQGATLSSLVAQATEFKLRPRYGLYQDTASETWQQVIPICDAVFRHLTEQILGFSYSHYVEFPEQYLRHAADSFKSFSPLHFGSLKLLDIYKYLHKRRLPRGVLLPFNVSQTVYATVPLLFSSWASSSEALPSILEKARQCLALVCWLEQSKPDHWSEWNALRQRMLWAWKTFCY